MASVPKIVVYMFMIAMLIFGTANTIVMKGMDVTKVNGHHFEHPYFQCATMFAGEFMCLGFYGGMLLYNRKKTNPSDSMALIQSEQERPKTGLYGRLGKFVFCIPSVFDMTGSTLMFIGLALTGASIYQMVRGFIIVVVALYSILILKRTLFRHQVLGVVLTTLGVAIVGLVSVVYKAPTARNPLLGLVFLLVAQFFAGGVFVSEELFLGNVKVHPMQAIGIEGASGFCYYLVLLPIMYFIPCSDGDLCSNGKVEDSIAAFRDLGDSSLLMVLWISTMLSIALFNWTGITTTKYASALARSTVDTSRTLLVWGCSILFGWEDFLWQQLGGFLLLLVGTLIYNEVLILPFWGFRQAVEKHAIYIEKIKNPGPVEDETSLDYIGFVAESDTSSMKSGKVNGKQ